MIEEVWKHIKNQTMLEPSDSILVAVSGGADSVCLLLLLNELRTRFPKPLYMEAIHIEHGIRGEDSQRDADFVARLCEKQNIPLHTEHYQVAEYAKKQGLSVEEAGRYLRYLSFEKEANRIGQQQGTRVKIAVAHNANDNAETILFHLARGTGLDGLRGIPGQRGNIIRPLLCVSRGQIEQELSRRQQDYCVDATNLSDDYDRNKLRHQVLPVLEDINSGALENITRTSGMLQELSDFLHRQCSDILREASSVEKVQLPPDSENEGSQRVEEELLCLNRRRMLQEDIVLQKEAIHQWICSYAMHGKDITAAHINSVTALLQDGVDKILYLPYQLWIYATYEKLIMGKDASRAKACVASMYTHTFPFSQVEGIELLSKETQISMEKKLPYSAVVKTGGIKLYLEVEKRDISQEIPLKTYVKWFDFDKISGKLDFRNRNTGDYFTVNRNGGTKRFKDYCINEKIPRQLRDEIPLICQDSEILWAVGYRISEKYKIDENTKTILKITIMEENVQ